MVAAVLVVGVAAAAAGVTWRAEHSDAVTLAAQSRTIARLDARIKALEAGAVTQPDWPRVAATVEPSVFTIHTARGLGSAWVASSDESGSELVTNFHVVAAAMDAGSAYVEVRQKDQVIKGTVVRVDRNNDLAVVHVAPRFPALKAALTRPQVGATVMAVGSPLGLGGSVSVGVVSGFRSLEGSDYMQFSAPISPGSSGGPVVDRDGLVVAVASAKLVGEGVEALSLAIPVQTACAGVVACARAVLR